MKGATRAGERGVRGGGTCWGQDVPLMLMISRMLAVREVDMAMDGAKGGEPSSEQKTDAESGGRRLRRTWTWCGGGRGRERCGLAKKGSGSAAADRQTDGTEDLGC